MLGIAASLVTRRKSGAALPVRGACDRVLRDALRRLGSRSLGAPSVVPHKLGSAPLLAASCFSFLFFYFSLRFALLRPGTSPACGPLRFVLSRALKCLLYYKVNRAVDGRL